MMKRNTQAGFTLVELIVAAGIFMLIAVNVSMLFISALSIQYRSTGIVKISENVQFAMESIAREIRVATIAGPNGCSSALVIQHPTNGIVTYTYDASSGVLKRNNQVITSPDVNFTKFSFCVTGTGVDNQQARVTMPMTVVSVKGKPSTAVTVSMQATVASRDVTEDLSD